MKFKSYFVYALIAGISMFSVSCSDDEEKPSGPGTEEPGEGDYVWGTDNGAVSCDHLLFNEDGTENPEGTVIGNGDKDFVFTGNQTLKKGTYLLKGWVYIANGAQLTIEPGTVIKGDKTTMASLIVEKGGKLIAQGSATEPIVFTSNSPKGQRKPGDWGGVIICGQARNNQDDMQIEGGPRSHHGGSIDDDNSGVLSYVRIEFAGYPFQTDQEINGLTLGSVGSGTKIDHVQVSFSNDDSFEWFGGTVDCKYLIAYRGWDDDFDTDNGFSGNVQFCLSFRDPRIADTSRSNGFESDNCSDGADIEPYTTCTFSNVTFVGPCGRDNFANTANEFINGGDYFPNNGSALGQFQSAMQIRRGSRLNCHNSVAVGFPVGIIIDGQRGNTVDMAKNGTVKVQNVWFAGMDILGSDFNGVYEDVLYDAVNDTVIDANQVSYSHTYFLSQSGNKVYDDASSLMLSDPDNIGAGYMPQAGSPLLTAASFEGVDGMDNVSYIGAFAADDNWMDGWTNFDPNNTDY